MLNKSAVLDEFEFREITTECIPEVKALHDELFPVKYTDSFYDALLKKAYLTKLLFHIPTHQLIGVSSYRIEYKEDRALSFSFTAARVIRMGYLATFGIKHNYRRAGLGKYLLEKSCEDMIALGCEYIELHVEAENTAAIKLYTSCQFIIQMKLPEHYYFNNSYHDAYLLVKTLPIKSSSSSSTHQGDINNNHNNRIDRKESSRSYSKSQEKNINQGNDDDIVLPSDESEHDNDNNNNNNENDDNNSNKNQNNNTNINRHRHRNKHSGGNNDIEKASTKEEWESLKEYSENSNYNDENVYIPNWTERAFSSLFPKCIVL